MILATFFVMMSSVIAANQTGTTATTMVALPGGTYTPYLKDDGDVKPVAAFQMDAKPVTVGEFLSFVKKNPEWRRSKAKALFADSHYLESWRADLRSDGDPQRPVTEVSWFAARAYCESQNKNLPTTDQWEYAADDKGRDSKGLNQRILAWYGKPKSGALPAVGQKKNGYGIFDLHGLIWEWTSDFNGVLISGVDQKELVCGGAAAGAKDPSDYAKFMRYAFRDSLKARYTTRTLGFRCVKKKGNEK